MTPNPQPWFVRSIHAGYCHFVEFSIESALVSWLLVWDWLLDHAAEEMTTTSQLFRQVGEPELLGEWLDDLVEALRSPNHCRSLLCRIETFAADFIDRFPDETTSRLVDVACSGAASSWRLHGAEMGARHFEAILARWPSHRQPQLRQVEAGLGHGANGARELEAALSTIHRIRASVAVDSDVFDGLELESELASALSLLGDQPELGGWYWDQQVEDVARPAARRLLRRGLSLGEHDWLFAAPGTGHRPPLASAGSVQSLKSQ